MSRGELIIDDNQVKPASGEWAAEFQHDRAATWTNEFLRNEASTCHKSLFPHIISSLIILLLIFLSSL